MQEASTPWKDRQKWTTFIQPHRQQPDGNTDGERRTGDDDNDGGGDYDDTFILPFALLHAGIEISRSKRGAPDHQWT